MAPAVSPAVSPTMPSTPQPTTPGRLALLKAQHRSPGEASFFYFDAHFKNDAVKVLAGEYFVHDEDILITTTLGSCIAACLWDRNKRIGGMNHFLLPDMGAEPGLGHGGNFGGSVSSTSSTSSNSSGNFGRYGAFAMAQLIAEMVRRGATRASMQAKVFGGGAVVSGMDTSNVGERNTAFVLDYLHTAGIVVVSKDVLGIYPRMLCFLPASGKAFVKRLATAHSAAPMNTP